MRVADIVRLRFLIVDVCLPGKSRSQMGLDLSIFAPTVSLES